jgi:tetratricopeptide (TPR) repeat protein
MLYSAAGQLQEAAHAFAQALAIDERLAAAHGFAGYNAALLGRAWETLPAMERAMHLDQTDRLHDRLHNVWFFFGGFAELLIGRTEAAIALLGFVKFTFWALGELHPGQRLSGDLKVSSDPISLFGCLT